MTNIEHLFDLARTGKLSKGQYDWSMKNRQGLPLAHAVVHSKRIPNWIPLNDATFWLVKSSFGGNLAAHSAARFRLINENFPFWDAINEKGVMVAEILISKKIAKPEWAYCTKTNKDGIPLCHAYARNFAMPNDYPMDLWGVRDRRGNSTAAVAAYYKRLPEDFPHMDWHNHKGESIFHVLARVNRLPKDFSQYGLETFEKVTVAHILARRFSMPDGFDGWHWQDFKGRSVAAYAAEHNNLPENFTNDPEILNLTDHRGFSVKDIIDTFKSDEVDPLCNTLMNSEPIDFKP